MKKLFLATILLISTQHIFAQLSKGMISVGLTSSIGATKQVNESNNMNGTPNNYYYNYTSKSTSYNISPSASYFIAKHFAIGLQAGYTGYTQTQDNTNKYYANTVASDPNTHTIDNHIKTTSAGFTVMPYLKYYIPLSHNVYFLLQGSYGTTISNGKTSGYDETTDYDTNGNVMSSTRSNEYGPNKTKSFESNFGISPGMLFMPNEKIGFEFSLGNLIGINSTVSKTTNSDGDTSKNTMTSLQYLNINTLRVGTGIYYFFK
jgi:hypothetical protein